MRRRLRRNSTPNESPSSNSLPFARSTSVSHAPSAAATTDLIELLDAGNDDRLATGRHLTPSAVLVPVFRDNGGELRVVLVVRGLHGLHGGELSLPGGKQEPSDASLHETALRESEEEIGLTRNRIEIITVLEPIDTRTTGFRVHPYLARVRPPERWQTAPGEITEVVILPVRLLADPAARDERRLSFPRWPQPRQVECISLEDGRLLWGLTLRLLDAVVPRLLAGEWTV
jgi:8-oxo-dGTP pyrophosphatase MutT (NUDIX family)